MTSVTNLIFVHVTNSIYRNLIVKLFFKLGVREAFNPFAVLELSAANLEVGEVQIKGLETGLYLGMDSEGRLYTESDPKNESTVFIETAEGHYLTYLRYLLSDFSSLRLNKIYNFKNVRLFICSLNFACLTLLVKGLLTLGGTLA